MWSVSLAAAMFSLLATLKRWNLNPLRWLTWYLESCAAAGGKPPSQIESFLPWNLSDQRRLGLVVERQSGGHHVFDPGHAEAMELESTSLADLGSGELRRSGRQTAVGDRVIPTLES